MKFVLPHRSQHVIDSQASPSESARDSSRQYDAQISSYLLSLSDEELSSLLVPDKILQKYAIVTDIVRPTSTHSCCFTKAYGNYALGTGSILQHSLGSDELTKAFKEYSHDQLQGGEPGKMEEAVECLRKLNLRYFAPKEVANLMCFPNAFHFPPSLSRNQCYKVMGNSLNVYVVSILMTYLFCDTQI